MAHKHMDAFHKDLDRLLKEAKEINAKLKKNPKDSALLEKKKKLAPFLTEQSLTKRRDLAAKLDSKDTGSIVKECGLPGW